MTDVSFPVQPNEQHVRGVKTKTADLAPDCTATGAAETRDTDTPPVIYTVVARHNRPHNHPCASHALLACLSHSCMSLVPGRGATSRNRQRATTHCPTYPIHKGPAACAHDLGAATRPLRPRISPRPHSFRHLVHAEGLTRCGGEETACDARSSRINLNCRGRRRRPPRPRAAPRQKLPGRPCRRHRRHQRHPRET